jgi:DNA mismatch endonuclease, patch repair protein
MAAVKGRNTRPELALRSALHRRGLRFRVNARNIPGKPDIANRSRCLAIFVDGDFWHGNPDDWKRRGYDSLEAQFRSEQRDRWVGKIRRNIQRDEEVTARLISEHWTVVRIWASEVSDDLDGVVDRIVALWKPTACPD